MNTTCNSALASTRRQLFWSAVSSLAVVACAGSEATGEQSDKPGQSASAKPQVTTAQPGSADGGANDQRADAAAPELASKASAVRLAAQLVTPDDYLTYVRVFSEVPEGEVDLAGFREFGNANAYTFGGYVFVEEDGVMTRFTVDDDLQLVDELPFSWADYGVSQINESYTVFASMQRAYTIVPPLDVVIVWSPAEMIVEDSIELHMPKRPAGMDTYAYDGHLVGDKVIWNLYSANWDTLQAYPKAALAIADAKSSTAIRFVEDDRCIAGGPSFLAADGTYYVHAGAFFGQFLAYGEFDAGRTCLLRVNAGETDFDPSYLLDAKDLTGTYLHHPWVHVEGPKYVVRALDLDGAIPEDSDHYWSVPNEPLIVDIEENTAQAYPDIERGESISGMQFEVDGTSYYEVSETGYVEGGNTDVVALGAEGVRLQFHLRGFLLGLERVR